LDGHTDAGKALPKIWFIFEQSQSQGTGVGRGIKDSVGETKNNIFAWFKRNWNKKKKFEGWKQDREKERNHYIKEARAPQQAILPEGEAQRGEFDYF